jgi:hypothetical protein
LARLFSAVTRGLNDYLDWLEAEYDIRIEAYDLSDYIVEGVDQYQAEFDAIIVDFRDAVDEIEKRAFSICDSIEEDDSTDAYEKTDEVLGEARERILKESGRLAERLNSLNLRPSWRLPSDSDDVGQPRVKDNAISSARFQFPCAWICAEGCGRIEGAEEYERHRTSYPDHHPQRRRIRELRTAAIGKTLGRDFGQTQPGTPTDQEEEIIIDAIEEVFKFWVESKDGVVTWRTIDTAAKKHKINPNMLGSAWQRVGFREKSSGGLDEDTRALMLYFSHRKNRQWVER